MPRDGSGIYTTPVGTTAVPDTTIESAKYNANVADVAADLNAPRPIIAGGTGATSATGALTALGAVAKAGDTMTGNLEILKGSPLLYLHTAGTGGRSIFGMLNGTNRWLLQLGTGVGNDEFLLASYGDTGTFVGEVLNADRATRRMRFREPAILEKGFVDHGGSNLRLLLNTGDLHWDSAQSGTFRKFWDSGNATFTGGYLKLANGFLLQWGTVGGNDTTTSFPIAFPNAILSMSASAVHGTAIPSTALIAPFLTAVGLTAFSCQMRAAISGGTVGTAGQNAYWTAIGY